MIKNKKEGIKLFKFLFISNKTKFKRLTQPGLTRYNWVQQEFEEESSDRSKFTHCSNAEELIQKVPPVEGVHEFGWGHPIEYIKLNTKHIEQPNICKYCGLRFVKKETHHH